MSSTNIRFLRVASLPTSGYATGEVYFVTSEKKIYVRTASGWEAYAGGADGADGTDGTDGTDGKDGQYTSFVFLRAASQPATPTATSPVPTGWSSQMPANYADVAPVLSSGSWVKSGNVFTSNTISHSGSTWAKISFTTTEANTVVGVRITASSEPSYDKGYVCKLDSAYSTSSYLAMVSGVQSKTVEITVATAGTHYIYVGYTKDGSTSKNNDNAVVEFLGPDPLWMTCAVVSSGGTAGTWSAPVRLEAADGADGEDGADGHSPYIGANGDWYEYDDELQAYADSGVAAKGDKGDPGTNGTNGTNGKDGKDGADGTDGADGAYFEFRYAVNTSATSAPSITKTSLSPTGWSTTQPSVASGSYLWMSMAKISGDGASLLQSWSTPIRMTPKDGVDGKDGDGSGSSAYYLEQSALDDPATDEAKTALDGVVAAVEAGTPVFVSSTTSNASPFTEVHQIWPAVVTCNTFTDSTAYTNDKYLQIIVHKSGTCIQYSFYRNKTTGVWTKNSSSTTTYLTTSGLHSTVYLSDTSGVPSGQAVWKAIHAETPVMVTAAVTQTLTNGGTHKFIIPQVDTTFSATYTLPSSPMDGETFVFLKFSVGVMLTIKAGALTIFNGYNGSSASSWSSTSYRRAITVTYSASLKTWLLMASAFVSL